MKEPQELPKHRDEGDNGYDHDDNDVVIVTDSN